jgi:hypothetical protein
MYAKQSSYMIPQLFKPTYGQIMDGLEALVGELQQ